MGYYEFPHTRNYDTDLGYLIKQYQNLRKKVDNLIDSETIVYADPLQWSIDKQYKANTIVIDGYNAYLSKKPVPLGIEITNTEYWLIVGDFYKEFDSLENKINESSSYLQNEINGLKNNDYIYIDVTNHGLKGDNTTDNSEALTSLINNVKAGEVLYFPVGIYKFNKSVHINKNIKIKGSNINKSILNFDNCNGLLISEHYTSIEDLKINLNHDFITTPSEFYGIKIGTDSGYVDGVVIKNVFIEGFSTAIECKSFYTSLFDNVNTQLCKYGIRVLSKSVNNIITNCKLSSKPAGEVINGSVGIYLSGNGSEGFTINNTLTYGFFRGIECYGCSHVIITDNIIDFSYEEAILLRNGSFNCIIANNYIATNSSSATALFITNSVETTQLYGHKINNNIVINYSGTKGTYGLLIENNIDKYCIITDNSFNNFNYGVYITDNNHIITNNVINALNNNIPSSTNIVNNNKMINS